MNWSNQAISLDYQANPGRFLRSTVSLRDSRTDDKASPTDPLKEGNFTWPRLALFLKPSLSAVRCHTAQDSNGEQCRLRRYQRDQQLACKRYNRRCPSFAKKTGNWMLRTTEKEVRFMRVWQRRCCSVKMSIARAVLNPYHFYQWTWSAQEVCRELISACSAPPFSTMFLPSDVFSLASERHSIRRLSASLVAHEHCSVATESSKLIDRQKGCMGFPIALFFKDQEPCETEIPMGIRIICMSSSMRKKGKSKR